MVIYEADSLGGLIEVVESLHRMHVADGQNEHLWYRGQADWSWSLAPSIQRYKLTPEGERGLANDFYTRASHIIENAPSRDDYAAWLSMMQHYGMPTRLLDWSESPLIAAFFAADVGSSEAKDGCIWVLRPGVLNSRQGENCLHPMNTHIAKGMMQSAFVAREPDYVRQMNILACYATGDDVRMYAQQACFTIHRSRSARLDGMVYQGLTHRIRIPALAKERIRYQLTLAGISERFVYPDLEHVAQDVRRMHGIG